MLRILLPAAGLGAFALVTPVTGLILLVLAVICLCYRQVVAAYLVSGGSYVVSRENFGYNVAQIPGAAREAVAPFHVSGLVPEPSPSDACALRTYPSPRFRQSAPSRGGAPR